MKVTCGTLNFFDDMHIKINILSKIIKKYHPILYCHDSPLFNSIVMGASSLSEPSDNAAYSGFLALLIFYNWSILFFTFSKYL